MTGGIYLLLGSNLGDREKNLSDARSLIASFADIPISSEVYVTGAWGKEDQPAFLNQALRVETDLEPGALLDRLLDVELKLGRVRKEKWGSRTIDIDMIFYNDRIIKTERLTIPHPEIQNRRFALIPLREIGPDFIHPVFQKTITELNNECTDKLEVTRLLPPRSGQSS